uniref:Serine/threonine-protein kinase HT1 n=1 Tax=Rhizophora mucronata TaxID=61149 RepID=A0A2P2JNA8_RHIMU
MNGQSIKDTKFLQKKMSIRQKKALGNALLSKVKDTAEPCWPAGSAPYYTLSSRT